MLAILLGTATIMWSFVISYVADRCGVDVSARFLERGDFIPSRKVAAEAAAAGSPYAGPPPDASITEASLSNWIIDPVTAPHARQYAYEVIPFDFVFMALLGAFTAVGSSTFLETVVYPNSLELWHWLLLLAAPIVYVVSDATEDVLIIRLLRNSGLVNSGMYAWKCKATSIKAGAATVALLQTAGLGVASWIVSVGDGAR